MIIMNIGNSKTVEPHKFALNLSKKLYLKGTLRGLTNVGYAY